MMYRPTNPILLSFFLAGLLFAIPLASQSLAQTPSLRPAEPVCELPDAPFEGRRIMAAPATSKRQKAASFTINFLTGGNVFGNSCDPWPQNARDAFLRAASTWEGLLDSPEPIEVDACWTPDLVSGTLGSAGPRLVANFGGAPHPNTYYPLALANAIEGYDLFTEHTEIQSVFNADRSDWYFGSDPNAIGDNEIDFETVVLHELGHGLGFVGSAKYDDGAGSGSDIECDGTADHGCLGSSDTNDYPYAYDHFVEDDAATAALDFPDPSADLGTIFTGSSVSGGGGGIFFNGNRVVGSNGGVARLYSPSSWQGGSSYSHWDQSTFPNEMMHPMMASGQALRDPQLALELLEDIGWAQALPVELTAFEAVLDHRDAVLAWTTASETNNAGFEVQHARAQSGAMDWTLLAFVEGAGTTNQPQQYRFRAEDLAPGTHRFRLRQVDVDGTSELSPVVEVALRMEVPYRLSAPYPNPARGTAQMELRVQNTQAVRAVLYDAMGREVAVLHNGPVRAHTPLTLRVDGPALTSGLYLVRVTGTSFVTTRRVSLVR